MSINCRFALDVRRYVIDAVNVAKSGKGYCPKGDPEDDKYLRERVLQVCLSEMLEKLIINVRPTLEHRSGERYQPFNEKSHAIWVAILYAIRASHLNTFDPALSVQHKFDGKLRRQKKHTQDFTSLALFRDDVECLLRDLYGDLESEALGSVVWAVLCIVQESRDMCARIFGKNMRTPWILTGCLGSVCQKELGLVAVTMVAEWQRNLVSSNAFAR